MHGAFKGLASRGQTLSFGGRVFPATFVPIGRIGVIGSLFAFVALLLAAGAAALVFKPSPLPAGTVGVPYRVVLHVSVSGHNPALHKHAIVDYTVDCFGADREGGFVDDCAKLPPGLKIKPYADGTCSPPLQKPACALIVGKPRKAGVYTFRIFVPDANSISVRGIATTFKIRVKA